MCRDAIVFFAGGGLGLQDDVAFYAEGACVRECFRVEISVICRGQGECNGNEELSWCLAGYVMPTVCMYAAGLLMMNVYYRLPRYKNTVLPER